MCGIVGIASVKPVQERRWLTIGRDAMQHRGPDAFGEMWSADGRVGLGHRRLSILDLSSAGHQPMALPKRPNVVVVFNGEIYNYRELRGYLEGKGYEFSSHSDTEVLLAAYLQWGEDCVLHLKGMFAFAIYDENAGEVFLARDRAGEKPLFYYLGEGTLRFASELKALLADPSMPRQVDYESLDCYLCFSFVPGNKCILAGYRKLQPGYRLSFSLQTGQVRLSRYWELPEFVRTPEYREEALVEELEALLQSAVRRQLVADVPVGLLLSGGIDSSLITALAARSTSRLKTFTVGFADAPHYDESRHAELIAKAFGTDHTRLEADNVRPEVLKRLAQQYDEPIVDSSMIPTFLVTQQISSNCKVALGGDGGDELFGGYHSASRMAVLERLKPAPRPFRAMLSRGAKAVLPFGARGREFLTHVGSDAAGELPIFMRRFDETARSKLLKGASNACSAEQIWRDRTPPHVDAVQRITRFDYANYLPEDILVKVDRASMLNSLEVRSPFLDVDVTEFAFRNVPSTMKASATQRKIILKRLASRILPSSFDAERKQGFGIPIGDWLRRGPWRSMFESVLFDRGAVVRSGSVEELFRQLDRGLNTREQLFGLCLFELWRREYKVTI